MKLLSQIKERKEFTQFNSYSPIFEFHVNYEMYTPRKISNIEWAILSAIYYLKPNPRYQDMLLKDVFEHIYCIPLSEQLVYSQLIHLYQVERLINCRDSAQWETIYLNDLELTEEGQDAFKTNKISTAPEEKIATYLFDPLEKGLVPNGAKGNCVENIPEQKELLVLRQSDDVAFTLPEGLVRADIEKRIQRGDDTEISSIELNTVKGAPKLLWNQLKVRAFFTTDGDIEIDMDKKQYIDYVNEIVQRSPYEILEIEDDPLVAVRKLNDDSYPIRQILFSAAQQDANLNELFSKIKGQRILQYVTKNHYETYKKHYEKFKGTLFILSNVFQVEHRGEVLIVQVPQDWFEHSVNYINNVGSNELQGRFELNVAGKPVYALLTYQLGTEKENLLKELNNRVSVMLEGQLNDANVVEVAKVMAGVYSDGGKGWQILRNRIRHLPIEQRLKLYGNFLKFVETMKIKQVPHVNEVIFKEMLEESKQVEHPFNYWLEALTIHPIGKLISDATMSKLVMDTIHLPAVSTYHHLKQIIQKMKELPIHVPTIIRECYRRLYMENIAVEHFHEVQGIYKEAKEKGAFFDKDSLTEAWKSIAKSKEFFECYEHLASVEFCKKFIFGELVGVLQQRIQSFMTDYDKLERLLTDQQLDAGTVFSLVELVKLQEKVKRLKDWIFYFGKSIEGKNMGRLFVIDFLAVLENPKIIQQLIMKDTVLLNREVIEQMEKHIYSQKAEVGLEGKLQVAKEVVEGFQQQSPKRLQWGDAKVELLPVPECIMSVEQSIAIQYVKMKPIIVTANEFLYETQGVNGAKIASLESILENLENQNEQKSAREKKTKKKNKKGV